MEYSWDSIKVIKFKLSTNNITNSITELKNSFIVLNTNDRKRAYFEFADHSYNTILYVAKEGIDNEYSVPKL